MYRHYWFCKSGTLIHEYYLNLYTNGSLPKGFLPGSTQPGSTKSQSFAWMEPLTFADVLTKRSGSVGFTTEKVGPDHGSGTFHLSVLRYQWPCHKCHVGTLKHVGSAADSTLEPHVEPTWSIWQDSLEVPWTAVFGLLKACLSSHCFLSSLTRAAGIEMRNES